MEILVYDSGGLFFYVADRHARDGNKVYYYSPRTSNYPTPHFHISEGMTGVERVDDPWTYMDKVDLIVYTDVNDADHQVFLRKQGYNVFGAGDGEDLELDRLLHRQLLDKLGLPVIPYQVLKGMDELEQYMRREKDKYLKISYWRGLKETHCHEEWDQDAQKWFYDLAHLCGVYRGEIEIIGEDSMPGVETGSDFFYSNGEFAKYGLHGFEIKNECYVCKVVEHSKLPTAILSIDDAFNKVYKYFDVRCSVSTEVRVHDANTGYYTDPCMRFGSPPGELIVEMYGNFTEIVDSCARGKLVIPQVDYKYGASIFLTSESVKKDFLKVEFPKKYKDHVKLRSPIMIEGDYYVTPLDESNGVAQVIGMADSLDEAVAECLMIAEEVKGEGLGFRKDAFDDAMETLAEAKKKGVGLD
jgi:hypothetical protein